MAGTFADQAVVLPDLDGRKVAERLLQERARVEPLDLRRAAGAILELVGAVVLHEQQPAGPQRPPDAAKDLRALRRERNLEEDADDQVVGVLRPRPGRKVGLFEIEGDAARGRERARLGDPFGRDIERMHIEPLLGKPHAVAALTVSES